MPSPPARATPPGRGAVAVLALVVLAAPAGAVATGGGPAVTADASVAIADASVAADPTVEAPAAVERGENLTATVSLPDAATDARTLEVRLDPVSGSVAATRTVTLSPGASTTVDLGSCRPTGAYAVRVASTDGEVLVAAQTRVEEPPDVVSIADEDGGETLSPNGTYALDVAFGGCRDRATVSVDSDDTDVWTAVVADADGDGRAGVRWDVDAPAGDALVATDGDEVVETEARNRSETYGEYAVSVLVDGDDVDRDRVTVSFADPTATVYRVGDADGADDALRRAREGAVASHDSVRAVAGDWVVLRLETDGTLADLPADERLVHPARYGNATVRVGSYGYSHVDGHDGLDLANATRAFDPETDSVWYAVRPTDEVDHAVVRYVAIGDDWNATAEAEFDVAARAALAPPDRGLLAPADDVTVEGRSGYPDGTEVTVAVRADGRVLAERTATVRDGRFGASLDLSAVANGTNATLIATRNGDRLDARNVTVVSRPVVEPRRVSPSEAPVAGDPLVVQVGLLNDGTARANETVTVALGNRTRTMNVTVGPGEYVEAEVAFDAVPDRERVNVSASAGGETRTNTVEVRTGYEPTTTPPSTTTGTEPWPTLAGSERPPNDRPLPGFGVPTVVIAALAGLAVLGRRRARGN